MKYVFQSDTSPIDFDIDTLLATNDSPSVFPETYDFAFT